MGTGSIGSQAFRFASAWQFRVELEEPEFFSKREPLPAHLDLWYAWHTGKPVPSIGCCITLPSKGTDTKSTVSGCENPCRTMAKICRSQNQNRMLLYNTMFIIPGAAPTGRQRR